MRALDFVYDVACPYAYLASARVTEIAERAGLRVRWRPILLGGLFRSVGAPHDPNAAMSAPKAALGRLDMLRWAELYGVPLQIPPAHPRRTVEAMRLCIAAPPAVRPAVSHALFCAYWEAGQDVGDPAVLAAIARAHGVDPAEISAVETQDGLREATAWAHGRGMFGVPSFVVGSRFWWGQDRLALAVAAACGQDSRIDHCPAPGLSRGPVGRRRVTFIHDFASPFSYLGAVAVHAVAARHGVCVQWEPILLGALFRAVGTPDVPLLAMSAARQAYVHADLADCAAARGVGYTFAGHFPIRSVLPLRVAIVDSETTLPIYRAAWADDRRVDTPDTLGPVLQEAGFDATALLAAAEDPAIKARLRDNTARAQRVGACGVPTVVVHDDARPDPLVLWGQDRLGMLDAVLSGWWPASG